MTWKLRGDGKIPWLDPLERDVFQGTQGMRLNTVFSLPFRRRSNRKVS